MAIGVSDEHNWFSSVSRLGTRESRPTTCWSLHISIFPQSNKRKLPWIYWWYKYRSLSDSQHHWRFLKWAHRTLCSSTQWDTCSREMHSEHGEHSKLTRMHVDRHVYMRGRGEGRGSGFLPLISTIRQELDEADRERHCHNFNTWKGQLKNIFRSGHMVTTVAGWLQKGNRLERRPITVKPR